MNDILRRLADIEARLQAHSFQSRTLLGWQLQTAQTGVGERPTADPPTGYVPAPDGWGGWAIQATATVATYSLQDGASGSNIPIIIWVRWVAPEERA